MLKMKIDNLEGLSDIEKTHYKKSGDEYVLDLDVEIKTSEDTEKLNEALRKERSDHTVTKSKLSKYKQSPEETQIAMDEVEELRIRAGKIDDEAISKLVATRLKPFDREKESLNEKLSEITGERDNLQSKLTGLELEGVVRSVADGLINPLSMQDAILRAKTMLTYSEEKQMFVDNNGVPMKEWFEKILPETNWAISTDGTKARGKDFTGKLSSVIDGEVYDVKHNPFSKDSLNITKQSILAKHNPALAEELIKIVE